MGTRTDISTIVETSLEVIRQTERMLVDVAPEDQQAGPLADELTGAYEDLDRKVGAIIDIMRGVKGSEGFTEVPEAVIMELESALRKRSSVIKTNEVAIRQDLKKVSDWLAANSTVLVGMQGHVTLEPRMKAVNHDAKELKTRKHLLEDLGTAAKLLLQTWTAAKPLEHSQVTLVADMLPV